MNLRQFSTAGRKKEQRRRKKSARDPAVSCEKITARHRTGSRCTLDAFSKKQLTWIPGCPASGFMVIYPSQTMRGRYKSAENKTTNRCLLQKCSTFENESPHTLYVKQTPKAQLQSVFFLVATSRSAERPVMIQVTNPSPNVLCMNTAVEYTLCGVYIFLPPSPAPGLLQ